MPPGRPRTVTDAALLDATARVVGRLGPARLTLAAVAAEAGLAPATLVQRFGSKRGLLLAFAEHAAAASSERLAAHATERPAPAAIPAALAELAAPLADPDELANHLALLQEELTDPPRRAVVADHARALRAVLAAAVARGVERGELAPCDAEAVGHALHVTFNGSLVSWAILREGSVEDWVRRDAAAVLAPLVADAAGVGA